MEKEDFIIRAIDRIEKKGYTNIRANVEGYDCPSSFTKKDDEEVYTPDITGAKSGGKDYFEIALKTENVGRIERKWKLLSTLAKMKNGSFFLFAPRGHRAFAEKITRQKNLNAEILNI